MKRIQLKRGTVAMLALVALFAAVAYGSDDNAASAATSVPVPTVAPEVVEPPGMTEDAMMADDKMSCDAMMVHEDHEFTIRIENISSGASVPSPLAPGAYVIHFSADLLYTPGQVDRGEGLAEDGGGDALAAAISLNDGVSAAVGFAFWNEAGEVLDGDITSQIILWDAGIEVNEAPGVGPNQTPRQSAAGEGDQESSEINLVADGFSYPDTNTVIKVTTASSK